MYMSHSSDVTANYYSGRAQVRLPGLPRDDEPPSLPGFIFGILSARPETTTATAAAAVPCRAASISKEYTLANFAARQYEKDEEAEPASYYRSSG